MTIFEDNTIFAPRICKHSHSAQCILVDCDSLKVGKMNNDLFCVGVMYSGEYDACDVTLSVYPHRASLKNMPGHGGNRTYDLWNTN